MPNTKPDLHFDEEGVCDACRSQGAKNKKINWLEKAQPKRKR